MNPSELIKTIYLGDRGCLGIEIEFWERKIKLKIDSISKVDPTEKWGFNENTNIDNCFIIFADVLSYEMTPNGVFADDFIEDFFIEKIDSDDNGDVYTFVFQVGCRYTYESFKNGTMQITIQARDMWLENPLHPEVKIRKW